LGATRSGKGNAEEDACGKQLAHLGPRSK
jgi:hypothetical protein